MQHVLTQSEVDALYNALAHAPGLRTLPQPRPDLTGLDAGDLYQQVRKGCPLAKRELLRRTMPFIVEVAAQHVMRSHPLWRCVRAGIQGCRASMEVFNPEMGVSFTNYTAYWVCHHIMKSIEEAHGSKRVQRRVRWGSLSAEAFA